MLKEVFLGCFKALPQHFPGGILTEGMDLRLAGFLVQNRTRYNINLDARPPVLSILYNAAFHKLVGREPICGGSRKVFEM
jgi:hypothetical protein